MLDPFGGFFKCQTTTNQTPQQPLLFGWANRTKVSMSVGIILGQIFGISKIVFTTITGFFRNQRRGNDITMISPGCHLALESITTT